MTAQAYVVAGYVFCIPIHYRFCPIIRIAMGRTTSGVDIARFDASLLSVSDVEANLKVAFKKIDANTMDVYIYNIGARTNPLSSASLISNAGEVGGVNNWTFDIQGSSYVDSDFDKVVELAPNLPMVYAGYKTLHGVITQRAIVAGETLVIPKYVYSTGILILRLSTVAGGPLLYKFGTNISTLLGEDYSSVITSASVAVDGKSIKIKLKTGNWISGCIIGASNNTTIPWSYTYVEE